MESGHTVEWVECVHAWRFSLARKGGAVREKLVMIKSPFQFRYEVIALFVDLQAFVVSQADAMMIMTWQLHKDTRLSRHGA